MPRFPSLEWCHALVSAAASDPDVPPVARAWGGRSVGVVLVKGDGLPRDFCVFAKPHPSEPRVEVLKECEDEDDLALEEPDFLFRVAFGTARKLLAGQLDPWEVLRRGQVRVDGDLGVLVPFGQKHQKLGERVLARVDTTF